jgi:uncharacterized protein YndB with AHSA1/START domain
METEKLPDDKAERELRSSRLFPCSRQRVFQAWTDPAQLKRWWGPQGFSNEFEVFDLRPGGQWIFTMIGPKGERYPNHSEFQEIITDSLIRFEHKAPQSQLDHAFRQRRSLRANEKNRGEGKRGKFGQAGRTVEGGALTDHSRQKIRFLLDSLASQEREAGKVVPQ